MEKRNNITGYQTKLENQNTSPFCQSANRETKKFKDRIANMSTKNIHGKQVKQIRELSKVFMAHRLTKAVKFSKNISRKSKEIRG